MSVSKDKRSNFVEITDFFSGGEDSRREMLAQPEEQCYCYCSCTTNCNIGDAMHPHTSGYFVSLASNPGSTGPGG